MLPTKRLIYALRRFDAERTAAVMGQTPSSDYQGYMSHKTKVYMVGGEGITRVSSADICWAGRRL